MHSGKRNAVAVSALALTCWGGLGATGASAHPKFEVLYSFAPAVEGGMPYAPPIIDEQGTLYGVTPGGDAPRSYGTLYQLKKVKHVWSAAVLHVFCSQNNCSDGGGGTGTLVRDVSGNLYGAAATGGKGGGGTIFKLTPNGKHSTFNVLYSFCSQTNCADGKYPWAGLTYAGEASGALYDGVSPLYGTTELGGNSSNSGVVYQLTPNGDGSWSYNVVYAFCTQAACTDGAGSVSTMTFDSAGNIYGVTEGGGNGSPANKAGVAYKLAPVNNQWTYQLLYSFCELTDCADGIKPSGTPVFNAGGNLVGNTLQGGLSGDQAVIYKLSPDGRHFDVLHTFCQKEGCTDGKYPFAGLISDGAGGFVGTSVYGGTAGKGEIYQVKGSQFKVLYSFCTEVGGTCDDGLYPESSVTVDSSGRLYGTTLNGGQYNRGVVYRFTR